MMWLQSPPPKPVDPPPRDYFVYVASEMADRVALVRFGPGGVKIERERYVGAIKSEIAGPHGVAVSPDGKHYFVSTAHGMPFGYLQKYNTATDSVEGNVALGNFPATVQVSPNGFYVFVSNFNLHGDMVNSSVSVVAADEMSEITRIETCMMPHGSRFTADSRKHYSTCMMDDQLIEIDTRTMKVSRRLSVGDGSCQPTWAQPAADGSRVWVACNKSSEIVEVDGKTWATTRRIPAGAGVYNLGLTHDGKRLLATNKRDQSMSVIDIATGKTLARIATTRKIVNGVTVSDDDRYAFVSIEGSGSQPGTMDVIDLQTLTKVASVDLGEQAGGIDFWKSQPARR
ncbi:MAG TPA: YncE family protein [Gemmatimonadaceae bacterium]|jgi:DNA-binding beta-propeller fold protein YncE